MVKFRLYVMDRDQPCGPPAVVECPTEIEAIEKARRLLKLRDIEVRRGKRVVTRLRPMDK
jgi:hypothetical protein